jgi:hypothetical protein
MACDLRWTLADHGDDTNIENDLLSYLPDPLGRYAGLITQFGLQQTQVVAPNICDGSGNLIRPREYRTKLATGEVVMVECQLKL